MLKKNITPDASPRTVALSGVDTGTLSPQAVTKFKDAVDWSALHGKTQLALRDAIYREAKGNFGRDKNEIKSQLHLLFHIDKPLELKRTQKKIEQEQARLAVAVQPPLLASSSSTPDSEKLALKETINQLKLENLALKGQAGESGRDKQLLINELDELKTALRALTSGIEKTTSRIDELITPKDTFAKPTSSKPAGVRFRFNEALFIIPEEKLLAKKGVLAMMSLGSWGQSERNEADELELSWDNVLPSDFLVIVKHYNNEVATCMTPETAERLLPLVDYLDLPELKQQVIARMRSSQIAEKRLTAQLDRIEFAVSKGDEHRIAREGVLGAAFGLKRL